MSTSVSTPPRTRKPRGQGASRRGEILAAATRIFLAEGVARATMRRIAAAVGLSTTALYVYFPDKNAIFQAIAEAMFAELLATLEAGRRSGETAEARLRAGLRGYVAFARARPDEYRLIFIAAKPPDADHCATIPDADNSFALLETGVQEMIDEGHFRPRPSSLVAEALWACCHGVTALLIEKADRLASPPDELVEQVLDMAIDGCR